MWIECHAFLDRDIIRKVIEFLRREIDPDYLIEPHQITPDDLHLLVMRPTHQNKKDYILRTYSLETLIEKYIELTKEKTVSV